MAFSAQPAPFILLCPDEILLKILQFMSPLDRLSFRSVSQKCCSIADDPMPWMDYCRKFKYWPDNILEYFRQNIIDADWKRFACKRENAIKFVEQEFETLITSSFGQGEILAGISSHRYDVKAFLIGQRNTPDDDPMVLSRRWWAQEALNAVHRRILIEEWATRMHSNLWPTTQPTQGYKKYRLESLIRTLGLAIFQRPDDYLETLSARLDNMASASLKKHPKFREKILYERVKILLEWFHDMSIVGPEHSPKYWLECVGHAPFGQESDILMSRNDMIIPEFFMVIFVTLAQRLDIPAYFASQGQAIAVPISDSDLPPDLRVSPEHRDSVQRLVFTLGTLDDCVVVRGSTNDPELRLTTEDEVVLRILHSFGDQLNSPDYGLLDGFTLQSSFAADHITECGEILLAPLKSFPRSEVNIAFSHARLRREPADAWAMERHVQHWRDKHAAVNIANGYGVYDLMKEISLTKATSSTESIAGLHGCIARCNGADCPSCPRFRIGDVVSMPRHIRRRGLVPPLPLSVIGIVVERCVSRYSGKPSKRYVYTCLCSSVPFDRDEIKWYYKKHEDRLVFCDEHSLSRVRDPTRIPSDIFFFAGKYAQRFDPDNCRFVSNLQKLYPHG